MTVPYPASEPELPLMPVVRKLLAARTVDACHAALVEGVNLLQMFSLRPIDIACEVTVTSRAQPTIVWQSGKVFGQADNALPFFEEWFRRARQRPGQLVDYNNDICGLVGSGGSESIAPCVALFVQCNPATSGALECALYDLAVISAQSLHRLRSDDEARRSRDRAVTNRLTHTELLKANVDLLWESSSDGALLVTQVFNDRSDLARRFQGRDLKTLTVADGKPVIALATPHRPLRAVRLDPDRRETGDGAIYITMCAEPAGRLTGTISTGPDIALDRLAVDVQTLETMADARAREDALRRETQAMLLGLRALLAPAPFREKLAQLAEHLAAAIGGDALEIVQLRPGAPPRSLLALREFPSKAADALQRILAAAAERDVTIIAQDREESVAAAAIFAVAASDIALVAIPYQAEKFYMICRARRRFGPADVQLVERFSLLLRQALVLRDDQDRIIHAAKLSALGQISTNIAHELRQPLNTISIAVQNIEILIERDEVTPEILKEKVDRVLQQVDRACKVMDKMRQFGRKGGGNYKSASLAEIAQSASAMMQRAAEKAGIALNVDVACDILVLADEMEIEQVLVNLIQNAIDAIADAPGALRKDKSRSIKLWSGQEEKSDTVALHIDDTGPGFAPEVQQHAMDAFFTTKEAGKGTGLGLSISHAILREHGGRLQIGNSDHGGRVSLFLRRPD